MKGDLRRGRFMWRLAACGCCNGLAWGGEEPRDCRTCYGGGQVWVNRNGVVVAWPGGPFTGHSREHGLKLWREPMTDLAVWTGTQMIYGPQGAEGRAS